MSWRVRHSAGFRSDIAELAKSDASAATRIATIIQEADGEDLTDDHFSDEERGLDIVWLRKISQSERLNLWRVKIFSLYPKDGCAGRRLIYAVDGKSRDIWFLAIMPREEDYEGPRFVRIRAEYVNLYISPLPG